MGRSSCPWRLTSMRARSFVAAGILSAMAATLSAQAPAPGRAGGAANPPRYVPADPIDFNDHGGWTSMFDGKTLTGWDGPPDLWRVEDGAIVVNTKADPPTGSVYLLYTKSEPRD